MSVCDLPVISSVCDAVGEDAAVSARVKAGAESGPVSQREGYTRKAPIRLTNASASIPKQLIQNDCRRNRALM